MQKNLTFSQLILNWFHYYGRKNLPWQKKPNLYKTWISEIMLQQTQVKTVIPYFIKFIKKFPNIQKLSTANLDKILYLWSGLGFYKRAVNIYKSSQIIKKKYNNTFPKDFLKIIKLPGIGKSTAGAILSLTLNYTFGILDANVKRILIRYYKISQYTYKKKKDNILWKKINYILPVHNTGKFNQGLMDLGSLICKRTKPNCLICPIKKNCLSQNKSFFIKKKKKNISKKKIFFLIIQYKHFILLKKKGLKKIWNKLFNFPIFKKKIKIKKWIKKNKKIIINIKKKKIMHKMSHIIFKIYMIFIKVNLKKKIIDKKSKIWYDLKNKKKIGLSSVVKSVIKKLKKNEKKKKHTS